MASIDCRLATPVKVPTSPRHWYTVSKSTTQNHLLDVDASPSAYQRRKIIYIWRVIFKDGSVREYIGKTIQPLMTRTYQHIRQAKHKHVSEGAINCISEKDFHQYIEEYANDPEKSQIAQILLGTACVVPKEESLSKTEQVYISGKNTHVQNGGFNKINANALLRDRIDRPPRKLRLDFEENKAGNPNQIVVTHSN